MADISGTTCLDLIDGETWQRLVGTLLDSDDAEIVERTSHEILSGMGSGTRLFRVMGRAAAGGRAPVPWTMVIKILTHERMGFQSLGRDRQAWDYWKREWHAYRSPWVQGLTGLLVSPRCLGTGESGGESGADSAWIAMEDMRAHEHRPWSKHHFVDVAQHIGLFNGGTLTRESWPSEAWFSREWIRGWSDLAEPLIEQLPSASEHPVAGRIYTRHAVNDLVSVWEHREQFYAVLTRLPQTICHNDVFPRNLFVAPDGSGKSVAIDWAFCGPGAIGQELSALVGATMVFHESRPDDWEDLERECLAGYTDGLRRAGWDGSSDEALLGYLASTVLRFGVGGLPPVLGTTLTTQYRGVVEHIFGCSYDDYVENAAAVVRFQQRRIHRVVALLGL